MKIEVILIDKTICILKADEIVYQENLDYGYLSEDFLKEFKGILGLPE